MIHPASKAIQDALTAAGTAQKAAWLQNYVKHGIRAKGTGMAAIREIIKGANKQYGIVHMSISRQRALLTDLMQQEYSEDKLAAVLYLQLFWGTEHAGQMLALIAEWFDGEYIQDWNVCDWLCVRLLTPLVDAHPGRILPEFTKWNKDANLWKARASLVPFAQCKTIARHTATIHSFSANLIKRQERFCKTAVGWVLREYSKIDVAFVQKFLAEHAAWTSREVVKNATKYAAQNPKSKVGAKWRVALVYRGMIAWWSVAISIAGF